MSTTGSGTEHDDVEELGDRDARFGQRHHRQHGSADLL